MKLKSILGILFVGILFCTVSCEYETIVPVEVDLGDEDVLFSTQVVPIFDEAACTGCHKGSTDPDLRAENAYSSLTSGGYVNLDDPASSEIVTKIEEGHATSGNLSATQKALLLKWIEQGAKDN